MNLRAKKSSLKSNLYERKRQVNALIYIGVFALTIGGTAFGVFGSTVYLNGQNQRVGREIALNEREIYRLDREIQNLKISIESRTRRDFIYERLQDSKAGLRPANPEQVVRFIPSNVNINSSQGKLFAYTEKGAGYKKIVAD